MCGTVGARQGSTLGGAHPSTRQQAEQPVRNRLIANRSPPPTRPAHLISLNCGVSCSTTALRNWPMVSPLRTWGTREWVGWMGGPGLDHNSGSLCRGWQAARPCSMHPPGH